jgi:hypothetical protein
VLVGWHSDQGEFEGVGLSGLNVGLVAHSPGHMLETKWEVALYLDDRATEGQRDALTRIFSGKAGGFMEQVAGFIGEVAGVRSVPIEYRAEGRKRGIRLGEGAAQRGGDGPLSRQRTTAGMQATGHQKQAPLGDAGSGCR